MRFRTLLGLAILAPLLLTGFAVMVLMYLTADRNATVVGQRLLASVTHQAAQQVYGRSLLAVNLARTVSVMAHDGLALDNHEHLTHQLLGALRSNPGITWISFSNTDGEFTGVYRDAKGQTCTNHSSIHDGKTALAEYAVSDDGARQLIRQDADSGYDPRSRSFYKEAVHSEGIAWLPPYIFFGQNIPGVSCAMAVRTDTGQLLGVISIDYDLYYLSAFAREAAASAHSKVMVFTPEGTLIAHSDVQFGNDTPAADAKLKNLADVQDPITAALAHELNRASFQKDGSRTLAFTHRGENYLACVLPVTLEAGPAYYVATVAPKSDFAPSAWQSSKPALSVVLVIVLLAALCAALVARGINRPLIQLMQASERMGKGDLEVKLDLGRLVEYRHLAQSLESMQINLRDWIRMRTSMNLAMEIQRRLLPAGPPNIPGLDIAGYSAYCDETGGDYYDFLIVDRTEPHQLLIALGDVMGHGLPSALLMAGTRGILRSRVTETASPAAILTHMNRLLYRDTEGKRFMTLGLASVNIRHFECTWASAGHDPPIIYNPADKTFREPEGGDVPLGVMEEVEYANYEAGTLEEGELLFMGSDGVWETTNEKGEQFEKERLKQVLADHCTSTTDIIKSVLLDAISEFRGRAPVKDDVTFIILKRQLTRLHF